MASVTKSHSFKATLERPQNNLGWTIIHVPAKVTRAFKTRAMLKVKGEINHFPFRTSLFPTGRGTHTLLVNKAMQKGANVTLGMTAEFRLEPDLAQRKITIPAELTGILKQDRTFTRWFKTLNYSSRKWLSDWIVQPKSLDARTRRAEQVAEQLLSTMEAERELPPVIKAAFARQPYALEGWQAMTPVHRRGHLLAIFYYRTPDGRDRRIAKTVQDALCYADRHRKP
ncbi:MAG TPA: YdeI/OmpD-associated family protein [Candidatus Saccharimonadales bacterium]|nr:YdeI/OmpD-associated family protein [Candidatus Saccharimonadales bacterium]